MSRHKTGHTVKSTLTRRELVGGTAKLGLLAAGGMLAGNVVAGSPKEKTASDGKLPARGEYLIKDAYVLSMDPAIGQPLGGRKGSAPQLGRGGARGGRSASL